MSHEVRAGSGASSAAGGTGEKSGPSAMRREGMVREQDPTESLLRFLGRLSRFGLAAGMDPLLKPAKPGN